MLKALASLHPLLYCLWYAAPVSLYFLYRALGCAASHWECRVKSQRQTFEDVAMLLVFSVLLMLLDHLEPFDSSLPATSASFASSSGSEEEELHGTASFKHLPHARAQPTRQRVLTRPLLLALGYATAFAAAMVLGVSGNSIRTSFDAWAMWAPPTIYIVGPLLGLVVLCICLGARASFLAGPEQLLLWLAILGAALGYHLLGLAISRGVAAPFTTSNLCERLVGWRERGLAPPPTATRPHSTQSLSLSHTRTACPLRSSTRTTTRSPSLLPCSCAGTACTSTLARWPLLWGC